jgi:hypothetical protein
LLKNWPTISFEIVGFIFLFGTLDKNGLYDAHSFTVSVPVRGSVFKPLIADCFLASQFHSLHFRGETASLWLPACTRGSGGEGKGAEAREGGGGKTGRYGLGWDRGASEKSMRRMGAIIGKLPAQKLRPFHPERFGNALRMKRPILLIS